ncbi:MAG: nucleotidyltransferase domain-containing protein [Fusobacteriaceae bacterium]|nr:nucleotidyltransferase domain-containing protein [Fusobacteriaceae bacterium]
MSMRQEQVKEMLGKVNGYARELFGNRLDSVILFGSYAKGSYDEESDIDIMIIADVERQELAKYRYDFAHYGTGLDLEYGVFHSFTLQDKKTFTEWQDSIPFYQNVLAEGIVYDGQQ